MSSATLVSAKKKNRFSYSWKYIPVQYKYNCWFIYWIFYIIICASQMCFFKSKLDVVFPWKHLVLIQEAFTILIELWKMEGLIFIGIYIPSSTIQNNSECYAMFSGRIGVLSLHYFFKIKISMQQVNTNWRSRETTV